MMDILILATVIAVSCYTIEGAYRIRKHFKRA